MKKMVFLNKLLLYLHQNKLEKPIEMKTRALFIGFVVVLFLHQVVFAESKWYYSVKGKPTTLTIVDSLTFLGGKFCKKTAVKKQIPKKQQQKVYTTKTGELKSAQNQIIFKLKENHTASKLIKELGLTNKKIVEYLPNFFELSINEAEDIFALSRSIYESDAVEFAIPNFTCTAKLHSYDTNQWGIKNIGQYGNFEATAGIDINALNAWKITKGDSTIKIALLDTGVKLSHEDLRNNLLPGYTDSLALAEDSTALNNGDYYPGENHGTHCAGIIVAEDNGIGITGVAPQCKLIPIRMHSFMDNVKKEIIISESSILRSFGYAFSQGTDVYSCSWESTSEIIEPVINFVSTQGRNGKGAIAVFSSGNNNRSRVNSPSSFASTISVGAISPTGQRWFVNDTLGSNYGVGLDLVAPGENILTTSSDKNSNSELPEVDTLAYDGKTSMAAPFVSGVAALMLSVNPDLTAQQLKQALLSSCRKLNYTYSATTGKPYGSWNNETGYGLVDAYNAIMAIMHLEGPMVIEGSNETFSITNLPTTATVDWSISNTAFLRYGATSSSILVPNYALSNHSSFYATVSARVHLANGSIIILTKDVYFLYSGAQSQNEILQGNFTSTDGQCWLEPVPYNATDFQWSIDNGWMNDGGNESCYFYTRSGFPYSGLATVTVEYKDAIGNPSSISKQFHIDMGDEYCLFPNPATSSVQITTRQAKKSLDQAATKEIQAVAIFNSNGLQVHRQSFGKEVKEVIIDVSMLKPGNYVVRIYDGKNWQQQKLIIEKN